MRNLPTVREESASSLRPVPEAYEIPSPSPTANTYLGGQGACRFASRTLRLEALAQCWGPTRSGFLRVTDQGISDGAASIGSVCVPTGAAGGR